MREHRIYTNQPLPIQGDVTLEEQPSRHLIQVLRLKPGTELVLFNGDGHDYQASFKQADKRAARVEITRQLEIEAEPPIRIHLGIGISKGERMDFAIQKSVELGVTAITPLITERCVVRLNAERMEKRLTHWRNIIIAACEQSSRRRLPELSTTTNLDCWLKQSRDDHGLLLDHRSTTTFTELQQPEHNIRLLIGPEGGISESERTLALGNGFEGVRMGPRILRTETAPLAAITAIQLLWGDFRE